jgi:ketosteroid isomerase-like protein
MSEPGPNSERVRNAFARWNAGERESLLAEIHPDVEIVVSSSQLAGGEPYRGHDGYRQWNAAMEESFERWQVHPDEFRESGDTVVALGHMFLRGRTSGVELDQETGWVIRFRDGQMWRFYAFLDHEEALAAGGLG